MLGQRFGNRFLRAAQGIPLASQHAKVDLKSLIVSVILIFSLSDIINLFCFLCFC
jgi:hypothetical protein